MDVDVTQREPWSRSHWLFFAGVLLAYVVIAWQSIHAPLFVLDDAAELAYVRARPTPGALWSYDCFLFFRPVKNLCFLAFDALLPLGMVAVRLLAVAIGLCSGLAVWALFRKLLRTPWAALAATACWLLAPTLVTLTAWLSSVNILLMSGLSAVSLTLFLGAGERDGLSATLRLVGAWLTALLAMLCYEGAVCLPILFVLLDGYRHPARVWQRRSWQVYAGLGSALLLYLLLRMWRGAPAQQMHCPNFGEMANWQVAISAPWFFWQHLGVWLWPFHRQAVMGAYYWGEVSLLLGCAWLGALALGAGCLWLRRRYTVLALGLAWALVGFLPMSNLLAFRNGPYGDYYLALTSMGLALACGWAMGALAERGKQVRVARLALVGLVLWRLLAVGESIAWSAAWNDAGVLLQRTLRTFPQAFSAMNEYARLQYQRGAFDECHVWTDRALALAPHSREAFELRALVAERRGNLALARQELEQFMQYGGAGESWGWYFQGFILDERLGDTNGAIRCYQKAIANRTGWSPDVLDAMNALAFFAVQRGDRREAIERWEQVVRIDPARMQVRQNLIRVYAEAGDKERAQAHWQYLKMQQHVE